MVRRTAIPVQGVEDVGVTRPWADTLTSQTASRRGEADARP